MEVFHGKEVGAGLETRVRAEDWQLALAAIDGHLRRRRKTRLRALDRHHRAEASRGRARGAAAPGRADGQQRRLTGLPNRRGPRRSGRLPREMSRARRRRTPLSLAIIDIDLFKAYNDANGHLAGDELLRGARWPGTRSCGARTRSPASWAARSSSSSSLSARRAGERDRRAATGATPSGQTVSAGLAVWDFEESAEALIGRADGALYGRRRVGGTA